MAGVAAAGWVVQITIPLEPPSVVPEWVGTPVSAGAKFQYFNVAMANPDKAIETAAKHFANTNGGVFDAKVVRALSSAELASLRLNSGEIKPA